MQELLLVLGVHLFGHPCLKPVPSLKLYQGAFSIGISCPSPLVLPHPLSLPLSILILPFPLFLILPLPPTPTFIFSYYRASPLSCSYLCLWILTAVISDWDPAPAIFLFIMKLSVTPQSTDFLLCSRIPGVASRTPVSVEGGLKGTTSELVCDTYQF